MEYSRERRLHTHLPTAAPRRIRVLTEVNSQPPPRWQGRRWRVRPRSAMSGQGMRARFAMIRLAVAVRDVFARGIQRHLPRRRVPSTPQASAVYQKRGLSVQTRLSACWIAVWHRRRGGVGLRARVLLHAFSHRRGASETPPVVLLASASSVMRGSRPRRNR